MAAIVLSVCKKIYEIKDLIPNLLKPSGSLIRGTDQPTTPLLISNESSTILETVIQEQKHSASRSPQSSGSDDKECEDDMYTIGVTKDTSIYEGAEEAAKLEQTLAIALATVVNFRKVPNDDTSKQLAEYVLKAFNTDDETLRQHWKKASAQEKPKIKLVCTVRSCSKLEAKYAKGKSDLYVRIGIIDATRQGEDIVKKENLLDWKKKGGVMPTGEIQETSVRKATLNPQWNETLELLLRY